ncbi:MAG: TPM domain-containing protein [Taibaiella sp.]|nr:TPM domain-containing protein [Taibaiella sp.]
MKNLFLRYCLILIACISGIHAFAGDKDFPPKPNPPMLVNDFGHFLTPAQISNLEQKLLDYNNTSSCEITIVTIKSLGDYDISEYAMQLGNRWGVGKQGKYNGVVILASMDDHKVNISPAKGLEGALPDIICGRIIRNEITPAFKQGNYYEGFSKAADGIIAATKGEYKADKKDSSGGLGAGGALLIIVIIYLVVWLISKRGGGGGNGTYMSRRGFGGMGPMFLGGLLGGGFGGGGGGDSGGGGGFGGFGGGGGFSGGGASGGW